MSPQQPAPTTAEAALRSPRQPDPARQPAGRSLDDLIPFSRPYRAPGELVNLERVLSSDHAHGDGAFTASATGRLREITGTTGVLLTSSGSHALDLVSILLGLRPGDEVILPTYTFPSAANAVALTGATCVFVDSDPMTGNIHPAAVEAAITSRTKAISVMHYGGVPVDLAAILAIGAEHGIPVVEDNAHGLGVQHGEKRLGTFGVMGIQSFHDTKNVHSGEGGALIINDLSLLERAEIVREKGTDRSKFLRGQVDKYSWVDVGSSYLMSELQAAVLDAQLQYFDLIQRKRHAVWDRYAVELADWADAVGAQLMTVPDGVNHAAHLFFVLMPDQESQLGLITHLRTFGIVATFHYVPLHSSAAGLRHGRVSGSVDNAVHFSRRLVRLPLWAGLDDQQIHRVIDAVRSYRPDPAPRSVSLSA
ncbi:dTDP-4-amino-4,6-dideoxygalactose transaminase [Plantibacter sp. YIM 135249]|jgi:dTDP-4-amino-4,6-dideoxygalactose transaminase|uniref:dTDP-4-amino-4,6-dideoxygalactose transaminase n=1 Tax=Plantibacter sp. YIM 135249 TaxID=3423918 RepID=UPI003D359117